MASAWGRQVVRRWRMERAYDHLVGSDQEISDWPIKITFLEKVETTFRSGIIKSRFLVMGFISTRDWLNLGPVVFSLTVLMDLTRLLPSSPVSLPPHLPVCHPGWLRIIKAFPTPKQMNLSFTVMGFPRWVSFHLYPLLSCLLFKMNFSDHSS